MIAGKVSSPHFTLKRPISWHRVTTMGDKIANEARESSSLLSSTRHTHFFSSRSVGVVTHAQFAAGRLLRQRLTRNNAPNIMEFLADRDAS